MTENDVGLRVLREPQDAEAIRPIEYEGVLPNAHTFLIYVASIIAIHGIGAHPDDTWTKAIETDGEQKRYVNWLANDDMLPAVVPNARIMRYGYESQWFGKGAMHVRVVDIANEFLKEIRRYRRV